MIIFKKTKDVQLYLARAKSKGKKIGFVPTMGALHQGHLSLVDESKCLSDLTVCSIFINPTQFNNPTDLEKYPVTIEQDIQQLELGGCDVLFLPTQAEVYPSGTDATETFPLGYVETILEGYYRPGHFQGVCQIVKRLLQITGANLMFLGQKDYQQCMVLKKLVALMRLNTEVQICRTIREADGLAMSSRNLRLSKDERQLAPLIYQQLLYIRTNIQPGFLQPLLNESENTLTAKGFKVDYVQMANADTLELINKWDGKTPLVALIAAYINDIRLIDNLLMLN
jgi:pantoate--beta-alanine ligase